MDAIIQYFSLAVKIIESHPCLTVGKYSIVPWSKISVHRTPAYLIFRTLDMISVGSDTVFFVTSFAGEFVLTIIIQ